MPPNFTLQDIFGSLLASLIFSLIFVAPGYTTGWLLDLFDFKRRSSAARFIIAIVLSMGISPILLFLVYHFASAKATISLLLLIGIIFAIILLKSKQAPSNEDLRNLHRIALLVAFGWVIFSILFIVDIQWGNRLYYNVISYDFTTRVAIVNAISRTGVPPINPTYFPGHPVRLTYLYYFWYIPASLVAQIGSPFINGYTAMIASVSWCGLALMAVIALYVRLRNPQSNAKAWKNSLLGISLLLITGLDVIPALALMITTRFTTGGAYLDGDIEHWNEQITAWIGSVSWAPHHVAALIACVAGVLLIQSIRGKKTSKQIKGAVIAGLAFASAIGLSVYVTLVFILFWGIWMIVLFYQKEGRISLLMAFTGIIALIAASPFLTELLIGGNGSASSGGVPLTFSVRIFIPVSLFLSNYPPALLNLILLLVLPINYLMELGFFFITGLLWIQEYRKEPLTQNSFNVLEIILLAVSVFIGSFIQSTAISSNDLGWRAWLPGQFILLIWSVDIINKLFPNGWRKGERSSATARQISRPLKIFVIIGLITTIVDVVLLRTWPMLVDAGIAGFPSGLSPDTQLGKRTLAARLAYDYINLHTPENTLIQDNPTDSLNRPIGLYANRPIAISGHTAYGVPIQDFKSRSNSIAKIFTSGTNWAEIDQICNTNYINLIVVTDLDPLWKSLPILNQERSPFYQNLYYAVYCCGTSITPHVGVVLFPKN
ncbi:MAG: hypothetical protein WAN58_20660 [Anaerolineales bacterium]